MNRALIVVDVQESFRVRPLWADTLNPGVGEAVNRLVIGHGATVESAARTVGFQDPRMLRRLRAAQPMP
jgi:hypothetical protein